MRSLRSRFELACRIGAFALLGWLLGSSLMPTKSRRVERASSSQLESRLATWTKSAPSIALHADFTTTPSAWAVDWLAALRHSGHLVTWTGTPPALAIAAEPLTDPSGGARIDIAAPSGSTVALQDDASAIDSVRVSSLGGSITTPVVAGRVVAATGGQTASIDVADSIRVRSILVAGDASWEGKFIVAALEERGWPVITRFSVAPNVLVGQSAPLNLDTSRIAAVIAVDTSVQALGTSISRYVRSGGGLVLAGSSALASIATDLAPGTVGSRVRPATLPRDTIGLGSTGFYPVANLRADGVSLERRDARIAVAARRVGAGRVIQAGYDDSWRWRMAGGPGSENAHRAWWAGLVSAVAYAPPVGHPAIAEVDAAASAPLASLIARIGPAHEPPPGVTASGPFDSRILLAVMMILLLAEWASRRLRGLK